LPVDRLHSTLAATVGRKRVVLALPFVAAFFVAASAASASRFVPVAGGFDNPVYVAGAPGDVSTLYVVERAGTIRIVRGGQVVGTLLDIRDTVWSDGEGGLLSVAFSPEYATNGLFYVDYTDLDRNTHVVEYRTGPDGSAIPSSARELLFVQQVGGFPNHKGGQLAFDEQGRLYVGMGDGGTDPNNPARDDPLNHGQDLSSNLGKLLRAEPPALTTWTIVANGLRNPWRFSFDGRNGNLWLGDVGAGTFEEVDFLPRARLNALTNFGWSRYEGPSVYHPNVKLQGSGRLTLPVYAYLHGAACAIVGGYVYRARYFYGDYCTDDVYAFKTGRKGRTSRPGQVGAVPGLVSFGLVGSNLYGASMQGTIFRFAP
jgi:glucose/arabinose dehydrogenase